ncbi:MAG: sulfur carrier protein ThiS [Arcobacteraceae bacterium]|jgi:sulfur carrier protein
MNLVINGETFSFESGKTIFDIMTELKIIDKVMAVAVNMNIVKKEEWSSFVPQENDKIELLQFVGGG